MSDYLFLKLDNITSCYSAFLRKDFGLRLRERKDFGLRLRYAHSPEIIEGFLLKSITKVLQKMQVYTQTIIIFKNSFAAIISHLNALL